MALTWSTEKIVDKSVLSPEVGADMGVTEVLIYGALMTGIGEITDANAAEVYARFSFYEQLNGAFLRTSVLGAHDRPRPITVADIVAHVGLTTNASYHDESRASWLKRVAHRVASENAATYRRAVAFHKAVAAPVLK